MFSTSWSSKLWNATPTTSPLSFTTGPPLLPGLMAASICMDRRYCPVWAYVVISTLLTTPAVIEMQSPPTGYLVARGIEQESHRAGPNVEQETMRNRAQTWMR